MRNRKLFHAIVRYGFALTTSIGAGVSCGGSGSHAVREGVTPHPCEHMPCSIAGRVLDADGTPLSGVTVECLGRTTKTDAMGSYTLDISGYEGGGGRVSVTAADGRETYGLLENNGGETQLDIRLEAAAPPGPPPEAIAPEAPGGGE
jgi:hypothetical protein